ncbi:RHTO0S11e06216g1_1 [Rhodotorula toruloides]|uniref:RHTO0S11e06216g1_1 n=1 Tax=Rhodotorula toruloides TaxID=5286 RepID=A0A061B7M1_RHOTO|nr:RHTO0S11e06216g1_1 [Rhodotorula toruloides]
MSGTPAGSILPQLNDVPSGNLVNNDGHEATFNDAATKVLHRMHVDDDIRAHLLGRLSLLSPVAKDATAFARSDPRQRRTGRTLSPASPALPHRRHAQRSQRNRPAPAGIPGVRPVLVLRLAPARPNRRYRTRNRPSSTNDRTPARRIDSPLRRPRRLLEEDWRDPLALHARPDEAQGTPAVA